jgi:hypothetical protein
LANWPNLAILLKELTGTRERNLLNELIFPVFFFFGITLAQSKLNLK